MAGYNKCFSVFWFPSLLSHAQLHFSRRHNSPCYKSPHTINNKNKQIHFVGTKLCSAATFHGLDALPNIEIAKQHSFDFNKALCTQVECPALRVTHGRSLVVAFHASFKLRILWLSERSVFASATCRNHAMSRPQGITGHASGGHAPLSTDTFGCCSKVANGTSKPTSESSFRFCGYLRAGA